MSATSPEMTLPGDGVGVVDEEREFVWDDYLEDTKSTAAPATSFKHVRAQFMTFLLLFSGADPGFAKRGGWTMASTELEPITGV